MLFGVDNFHILHAVVNQHLANLFVRMRGDLVDHRVGEGDVFAHPVEETRGDRALAGHRLGGGHHRGVQLIAVMRAVVHAHNRHRRAAGVVALAQEGDDQAHHRVFGLIGLLGDGQAGHLQRRAAENFAHARKARFIRLHGLGHARHDALFHLSVRAHDRDQAQVVVRRIRPVDDLAVVRLARDDAAIARAAVQHALHRRAQERAENVACAEVHPHGVLLGFFAHGANVVLRQRDARALPRRAILDPIQRQFHSFIPPFQGGI